MGTPVIGVLALQGAVDLHLHAFARLGIETKEVRKERELDQVDAIVMPGGES